jgi:hypothetical protein
MHASGQRSPAGHPQLGRDWHPIPCAPFQGRAQKPPIHPSTWRLRLPCSPAPSPGQEAAPAARWPPHLKQTEPYTNQQAETDITTISKPRQAPTQSKTPLNQWRCSTKRGVRPCSAGWRLAAITVKAPALRTLAVVSPTSHRMQWSGSSFKIDGEER